MGPSRRPTSNGRSPLVNQQRQITSFFSKKALSSSSSSSSPTATPLSSTPLLPKNNPTPTNSSDCGPSPLTPSPLETKRKKPLLVIGPSSPSTPASSKKSYGPEVVDKRIRVYWPLDQSWYEGCVKHFDEISGKHLVQYDDADEELLNLAEENIDWPVEEDPVKRRFRRLRRISVVEDDEEHDDFEDNDDEDWDMNPAEKKVVEDVSEDMGLEDDDDEGVCSGKRTSGRSNKRKVSVVGKLGSNSSNKRKNIGDTKQNDCKVPCHLKGGKLIEPAMKNVISKSIKLEFLSLFYSKLNLVCLEISYFIFPPLNCPGFEVVSAYL